MDLLLLREQPVTLGLQAVDVVGRGRHPDVLREREEHQQERDDDPAEDQARAARPPVRPDRAAHPPARQGRRFEARLAVAAGGSNGGVRPRRRPSINRPRNGGAAGAGRGR